MTRSSVALVSRPFRDRSLSFLSDTPTRFVDARSLPSVPEPIVRGRPPRENVQLRDRSATHHIMDGSNWCVGTELASFVSALSKYALVFPRFLTGAAMYVHVCGQQR